ncbi:uncharacterized protein IWZ02DRAFT_462901 [Phyllosticta citriasiana]|uniref:uncharacterized protein n=1 Tax=Phyllosticta citriasiana TaxID=595635 RepID=UPI0030FDECA4
MGDATPQHLLVDRRATTPSQADDGSLDLGAWCFLFFFFLNSVWPANRRKYKVSLSPFISFAYLSSFPLSFLSLAVVVDSLLLFSLVSPFSFSLLSSFLAPSSSQAVVA